MFKLEKLKDKAVLTIYGYVGGYYMDYRDVATVLAEITKAGYTQLDFHIHTYGGTVFDGNLICNFLESFKGEIDIYIDGVAASMGGVIIMSGTRIHIAENGFVMIHSPQGRSEGTAKQLIQYAKLLTSMEKNFTAKLIARTGKTEAEVKAWFDGTDYWFDADEAIAAGLADDKFSNKSVVTIDKTEVKTIGARAVFDRFVALTQITNKQNMDKDQMIKRYGLTGVTAQSTDEEILAAVDAKIAEGATAARAAKKQAIEAAADAAITEKKFPAALRDQMIARGEKLGLEDFKAMLADMKAYEPISQHIQGKKTEGTEGGEDRSKWGWDDYQAKAPEVLEAMPKADAEKFKALYKAKYKADIEL